MIRIVADANVYVASVISPRGNSAKIIDAAIARRATLLMCDTLYDELSDVLARDKFRRWLTEAEADDFVDAMALLAEWVNDRPTAEIPPVCDDPADNYLIALYQDGDAAVLVSGDQAVQRVAYPFVNVYSPRTAIEVLEFRHDWGEGFIPGLDAAAIARNIHAEGTRPLLDVYLAFAEVIQESANPQQAAELLPMVTVPSAVQAFVASLDQVREMLRDRGLGTRPLYASPEVAYLKLPPNPRVALMAPAAVMLPKDTIFATLQRCEDLPDMPDLPFDHWRVFGIGDQWPIQQIAPRAGG